MLKRAIFQEDTGPKNTASVTLLLRSMLSGACLAAAAQHKDTGDQLQWAQGSLICVLRVIVVSKLPYFPLFASTRFVLFVED